MFSIRVQRSFYDVFLGAGLFTSVVFNSSPAKASVDLSLLVGEWSEIGQCGSQRFVFTGAGEYLLLSNQDGAWSPSYEGVYVLLDDGTVAIAPSLNTADITVEISTLSQTSLVGRYENVYSDAGEAINFERCESR